MQPWITSATASGFVNSSVVIQGRSLTNASAVQVNASTIRLPIRPTQIVANRSGHATTGLLIVTTTGRDFYQY